MSSVRLSVRLYVCPSVCNAVHCALRVGVFQRMCLVSILCSNEMYSVMTQFRLIWPFDYFNNWLLSATLVETTLFWRYYDLRLLKD